MAFCSSRRWCQRQQHYLLAHMNYARLRLPLDHPDMTEFRLAMDPINGRTRQVDSWLCVVARRRPRGEQRNAVPVLKDDPLRMPQLSLWTDVQALQHFAFKSGHAMYLKRKREWFTADYVEPPYAVCWWRSAASLHNNPPTLAEAFEKCDYLKHHGPTAHAFTFKTASDFPMPEDD